MTRVRVGRLLLALALGILVLGVVLPQVVAAPSQPYGSAIVEEQRLSLAPGIDGFVDVTHTYEMPDGVTQFEVRVPPGAVVKEAAGFTRTGDRTYEWDGTDRSPAIAYQADVDQQIDRDDPIAAPGEYLFKDGGDWALIARPQLGYGWSWSEEGRTWIDQSATVDGPGAVSDRIAYLGEHDRHRHIAHGQEFVLIEPVQADLTEDPAAIFDSLEHASDQLRVGGRDETVFMVAAPTDEIEWGVRGLQIGPADLWVRDHEVLDDPDNVWLHEYVHTRQAFATDADARWFTEASAAYYAALLSYEQGLIDYPTFESWLARGDSDRYASVALVDPPTWRHHADYVLGALIAGELDRELRLASGAEAAFTSVFASANEQDGPVDHDAILRYVGEASDESIANRADAMLRGSVRPSTWNRDAHDAAFGVEPARFATTIEEVHVTGSYRDRPVDPTHPADFVPGEVIHLSVQIENRGDVTGTYDVPFRVGDVTVNRSDGRLHPGERTIIDVAYRVDDHGPKRLTVGEARMPITVRTPAHATVTEFSVEPRTVDRGGTVTVKATVRNAEVYPGQRTVLITRGGRTAVEQFVTLDAGETRTVEMTVTMPRSGTVEIAIAGSGLDAILVEVEGGRPLSDLVLPTVAGAAVLLLLIAGTYSLFRRRQVPNRPK